MSKVLAAWNARQSEDAATEILACCGSQAWARAMAAGRPYAAEEALFKKADEAWWSLNERDWMQAFACHPRIGEQAAAAAGSEKFAAWSIEEQAQAHAADEAVRQSIAEGNRKYEQRFGFTYIVCATGRSAEQMLDILNRRLSNYRGPEIKEAAEQQRQITRLRLGKWLDSNQEAMDKTP